MKLLVVVVASFLTLGFILVFDHPKQSTEQQLAQLVQNITDNQNKETTETPTYSPSPKINPTQSSQKFLAPTKTQETKPIVQTTTSPTNTLFPLTQITPTQTPTPIPTVIITRTPSSTPIPTVNPTLTPFPTPTQTPTPTPTPANQPMYSIESISATSPVAVKSDTTITAQVPPSSTCSIKVTLPSGTISSATALKEIKTAGPDGQVSWTWSINWNTKPGTATFTISCKKDDQNFEATSQFIITSQ